MFYRVFVILVCLNNNLICSTNVEGWGYITLHCRDNNNAPVDWWYIYKPPSDVVPFFELGRNFTFITPESSGSWEASDKYITANSMLQQTLAPIFRPTYTDHLAVAIYDKRDPNPHFAGSVARGVLMADELGGVWIHHTVPGLVNMNRDRPSFPDEESAKGHLLMCLSLDLDVMNVIVHNLKNVYPKLTYLKVPKKLEPLVPEWRFLEVPLNSKRIKTQQFLTRGNSLRVEVIVKPPGDKHSVYKKFSKSKNIVLDVYGQTESKNTSVCSKQDSIRNIKKISLKLSNKVVYFVNTTDQMRFAVGTHTNWMTLGSRPKQYWSCISNLDKEDRKGPGGDLVCVNDYKVWHTFDTMKMEEPGC